MAAGVHHARLLPVVHRAHHRLEWHVDQFRDGQRVHVGTQCDRGAGLAALENSDHAGNAAHVLLYLHPQRLEMRGHQRRRTLLGVAQLGMLVNVVPPGRDLVGNRRRATIDISRQRRVGDHRLRMKRGRSVKTSREK